MRRTLTRRRVLVALVVAAVTAGGWFCVPPDQRGAAAAHLHHALGHDEVKAYGMSPRWYSAYRRLVWERHRVWIDDAAGCVVSESDLAYIRGYNAASERRLRARFGDDPWAVFAPLAAEARGDR